MLQPELLLPLVFAGFSLLIAGLVWSLSKGNTSTAARDSPTDSEEESPVRPVYVDEEVDPHVNPLPPFDPARRGPDSGGIEYGVDHWGAHFPPSSAAGVDDSLDLVQVPLPLQRELLQYQSDVEANFGIDRYPVPLAKYAVEVTRTSDGDSGGAEEDPSGESTGEMVIRAVLEQGSDLFRSGRRLKFRCIGPDAFETDQGEAGAFGTELAVALLLGHTVDMWDYGVDDYGRRLVAVFVRVNICGTPVLVDYAAVICRLGAAIRYAGSKYPQGGAWYDYLKALEEKAIRQKLRAWGLTPRPRLPHNHRDAKRRGRDGSATNAQRRYLQRIVGAARERHQNRGS